MIASVASPLAPSTTGTILQVDGGMANLRLDKDDRVDLSDGWIGMAAGLGQVRVGPGADDSGGPFRLISFGEEVVGPFQRHEAARVPRSSKNLTCVRDADGVVGG